jgi:hypothetical protein
MGSRPNGVFSLDSSTHTLGGGRLWLPPGRYLAEELEAEELGVVVVAEALPWGRQAKALFRRNRDQKEWTRKETSLRHQILRARWRFWANILYRNHKQEAWSYFRNKFERGSPDQFRTVAIDAIERGWCEALRVPLIWRALPPPSKGRGLPREKTTPLVTIGVTTNTGTAAAGKPGLIVAWEGTSPQACADLEAGTTEQWAAILRQPRPKTSTKYRTWRAAGAPGSSGDRITNASF